MALWVLATPIGTLGDLSPRAREVLAAAAVVYCEDTRVTRRLLAATGVPSPPLVAVHAANEEGVAAAAARRALVEEVVLVSDAGTPGLSDPGGRVVEATLAAGGVVRSVPGPCALAAALSVSGLLASPSTFLGFPPRKGKDAWLRAALARPETFVVYEAPTRLVDLLTGLAALNPGRPATVCRELSKLHEEIRSGTLAALAELFSAREDVRGECVLVVGPGEALAPEAREDLDEGAGLKDVAAALARRWGVPRAVAYQELLALDRRFRQNSNDVG